jgi:hypothetical protein
MKRKESAKGLSIHRIEAVKKPKEDREKKIERGGGRGRKRILVYKLVPIEYIFSNACF